MDEFAVKKRRGRPKGSKDTRPRKPIVRTAFAYSQEQAKLVKYIQRGDRDATGTRVKGLKAAMQKLRNSTPAIPAERMKVLEQIVQYQLKLYDDVFFEVEEAKLKKKRYAESYKRIKEDSFASEYNSMLRRKDKQRVFSVSEPIPESVDVYLKDRTLRYMECLVVKGKFSFENMRILPQQALNVRVAYEVNTILHYFPDVNLRNLIRKLYFVDYHDFTIPLPHCISDEIGNKTLPMILALVKNSTNRKKRLSPMKQDVLRLLLQGEQLTTPLDFLYDDNGIEDDKVHLRCINCGAITLSLTELSESLGCPNCSSSRKQFWDSKIEEQRQETEKVLKILSRKPTYQDHNRRKLGTQSWNTNVKKDTATFVEEMKQVFEGYDYDYTETHYINNRNNVVIYCNTHKQYFSRSPGNLLHGWGCSQCMKDRGIKYTDRIKYDPKNRIEKDTKETFIAKSIAFHGPDHFDYSEVEYIDNDHDVIITCKTCGRRFKQKPYEHLRHASCKCYRKAGDNHDPHNILYKYIAEANKVHNYRYYYPEQELKDEVKIYCQWHGAFTLDKSQHLRGCGCPDCCKLNDDEHKSGETKGEKRVRLYLESKGMSFDAQHSVKNTTNLAPFRDKFRFDFMLKSNNIVIEYNGLQHYEYVPGLHKNGMIDFEHQQERDKAVRQYCDDKKYKLIEIPYYKYDEIESILDNAI